MNSFICKRQFTISLLSQLRILSTKSFNLSLVELDKFWLEILMYLIGSQAPEGGEELINGAVVSLRQVIAFILMLICFQSAFK